jgi:hypothetical protein
VGGFADVTGIPGMPVSAKYFTKSFAGYASWEFTEFNRLRVQYERVVGTFGGTLTGLPGTDFGANDLRAFRPGHIVMLQWTTVLGYHVHGFRGRWGT